LNFDLIFSKVKDKNKEITNEKKVQKKAGKIPALIIV